MKLSVTRALAEIRRIDRQLKDLIGSSSFIGVSQGTGNQTRLSSGRSTVEAFSREVQSAVDKISALTRRRAELKAAVVVSNANTHVSVNGRTVTVAEAIELRASTQERQSVLNTLRTQYNNAVAQVERINTKLEEQIESAVNTVYSSQAGAKIDPGIYEAVAAPKRAASQAALVDPANLAKMITDLEAELVAIETELDFTLSESNSRTEVEVADV